MLLGKANPKARFLLETAGIKIQCRKSLVFHKLVF
jgi:hypothetical protein